MSLKIISLKKKELTPTKHSRNTLGDNFFNPKKLGAKKNTNNIISKNNKLDV